jgi:hypothetical protein
MREGPANEGFGDAAISLSKLFVLRLTPASSSPPHRMNLPIRFNLPRS